MPTLTLSKKARLGQSSGLVAYPRDGAVNYLRTVADSRQSKVVGFRYEEVGLFQVSSIANGVQSTPGFGILNCEINRSLTCPKLNVNTHFFSNVTKKPIE